MVPPMSDLTLDPRALEKYLPHRGPNLLPDSVTLSADRTSAASRTRVGTRDPRGRDIFGRRDGSGRACWSEPYLAELMALTGVPLLHEELSKNGQVAVFSMISKIAYHFLPGLDDDVIGHAKIVRQRSGFSQYATRAECGGRTVLEAEVMSGAATFAEITSAPVRPFASDQGTPVDAGLFAWKDPALRFVDRIVAQDAAARRVVCAYTYPSDHPFVPGHFPGAALMMGVTQWSAAADAAWVARRLFGLPGPVVAQCKITREGGAEILDVRDLVLTLDGDTPLIAQTKRLAFREPVRPGDGILIEATVAPYGG
jgi:3-hydroxymyristoyl/3-hydroxydecanoyl-(acyl carrier protein) dehydratase